MLHETHLENGLVPINCSVSFIPKNSGMGGRCWDLNHYIRVRMENRVEVRDFTMGEAALLCHKMRYK